MGETVLSGIRATGKLHFGNFIGAVRNFVEFQQDGNTCLYFIADWHTLTTLRDPEAMRGNLIAIAKDYLAAGLDPERSIIYAQSSVPELAELTLYLAMVQSLGELQNLKTFKEMVKKDPNNVNLGTVMYPVMMAADILGPHATLVPVGKDQDANVELARELARRFNRRFGETFTVPTTLEEMVKLPGLDGDKMGKSDADNAIDIDETHDQILERYLKKGVTDEEKVRLGDPGDPYGRCKSVYPVHELVTPGERDTREIAELCRSGGIGCRECKERLASSIDAILAPFKERRLELEDKDVEVEEILVEGGKRARAMIAETTAVVRDKMGVVRYA